MKESGTEMRNRVPRPTAGLGTAGMWQRSFWDRHATNVTDLTTMVEYILANPIHARMVGGWSESPYTWSECHPETRGRNPNLPERAG